MSSPASLPKEIHRAAWHGDLQVVVNWLHKGGLVDALYPVTTRGGWATAETLLHAAAANGAAADATAAAPPNGRRGRRRRSGRRGGRCISGARVDADRR